MTARSLKQFSLGSLQPFGVDLFCLTRKYLIYNFVTRNLKLKYRRSSLGFLWSLLVPLSTAVMYYFVFQKIARLDIPNYAPFVVSALLPWTFFAQTVNEGMDTISQNFHLITKVPIPIQVFSFTAAATNFINLLLSFPVIIALAMVSGLYPGLAYVYLIPLLMMLFIITYSIALVLSIGYIFFRDLKHLMSMITQLWLYATPVLYTHAMIPEKYKWVFFANPVASVIVSIRQVVIENQTPEFIWVATTAIWTLVLVALAALVTGHNQKRIAECI